MKRKTLAILLSLLLVVSAVCVLASCNKEQEYEITLRDYTSMVLFKGQTIQGMITQRKILEREGYTFEGWYTSLTADDKGNLVYEGKVDLATKVFTEDTELFAKWTKNEVAGEEEGYCLIGTVNGTTNWTPADILLAWRFDHSATSPSLYTKKTDVKVGDGFKVKTFYPDWDTKQINYGTDKLKDVTLGEGVTLPEGIENAKALFDSEQGNITPLAAMNITIEFHYVDKDNSYINVVVNSIVTEEAPAA